MTYEDRPYQTQIIHDTREALNDADAVIIYAPTGSGKTKIACDITKKAVDKGSEVMFIGDSTEIIDQTSETLKQYGIRHGIIQAGHKDRRAWEKVHVATIQTLRNRTLPQKDLVFVDECHLARAASWETVISHYRTAGSKVIGLSATPTRLDGKGLGKLFQKIVECPSIEELTEQGYLIPLRVFCPPGSPDAKDMGVIGGDVNKKELAKAWDKPKLIGDAVEHYAKYGLGRLGIMAAAGIEHSKHLVSAFQGAGIPAAHCDGTTPREERRRILKSLPKREIMVLCQVDICGKGWDCKEVSYAGDCRTTLSLARWLQFAGRVLRIAPGKEDSILMDHAGNCFRFGMPDEKRPWTLDDTAKSKQADDKAPAVSRCVVCFRTFRYGPDACPFCHAPIEKKTREIKTETGELKEMVRERKLLTPEEWQRKLAKDEERRVKFLEFCEIAHRKGYKKGWPAMQFKTIFHTWPVKAWIEEAEAKGWRPVTEQAQGALGL